MLSRCFPLWVLTVGIVLTGGGGLFIWSQNIAKFARFMPHLFGIAGVLCVFFLIVTGFKAFQFHRIKYVFLEEGFQTVGGITLVVDFEHYRKLTDANSTRSILEQLTGCGTVQVEVDRNQYRYFYCLKNYQEVSDYFQRIVDSNFKSARRVNSI
jgi:hypothetical protein